MRGVLISLGSKEKKIKERTITELQKKIKEKEKDICNPKVTKKSLMKLKVLQEQLHCLLNQEIRKKNNVAEAKRI